MRWFPWQVCIRPTRQHFTTMLLLAGVFVALVPVPIVILRQVNGKDRSQPFPCQDRPCGCRTAEQCRKKCCCFTLQQKMAWAERHGVKTFDIALTLVETKPKASPSAVRRECCSSTTLAKSPSSNTVTRSHPRTPTSKSATRYKMVIGVIAQECQGVAQSFTCLPIFILPPVIALVTQIEPNGERLILELVRFEQSVIEPPVPPPRLIAV